MTGARMGATVTDNFPPMRQPLGGAHIGFPRLIFGDDALQHLLQVADFDDTLPISVLTGGKQHQNLPVKQGVACIAGVGHRFLFAQNLAHVCIQLAVLLVLAVVAVAGS